MERKKLSGEEIAAAIKNIDSWTAEHDRLKRRFTFSDFAESLAFVNKIGDIADAMDHHPDIKMGWGYAEVEVTTHDRGGITDVDFELARKIGEL